MFTFFAAYIYLLQPVALAPIVKIDSNKNDKGDPSLFQRQEANLAFLTKRGFYNVGKLDFK